MLSREAIKEKYDVIIERVDVWDDFIYVRSLSGEERNAYEIKWSGKKKGQQQQGDDLDMVVDFIISVSCDEHGRSIFKPEDRGWLRRKNSNTLLKIFTAGSKLAALEKRDIEKLAKNLTSTQDEKSTSESVKN